ncbi:MAG: peptidylprolyl isomerase [Sphingomonas sp.]|uniref:peptidylprolyl isomerase n=1 Tax=Sphingomonas sp. TaxID=28214 RepID=UPI0011F738D2|nr:peptidylprolyl isomerase [Sphingomonas sp.]THD36628.1 MAG: peptidylprolyl isomerase [Sphingomonas sp.]
MLAVAGVALAQTVPDASVPQTGLDIPENLQIFGKLDPNVRKPTAIVNGTVITGTDVDQRMALIILANQFKLKPEEEQQLRLTVLRGLIDEALQIQQAKTEDITASSDDLDQAYAKVAANFQKTPAEFGPYLRSVGSSARSVRRQIEGELVWQRYLRRRVAPGISVSDEEVKKILDAMNAARGTPEFHLKEIFVSATPDRVPAVTGALRQAMEDMKAGKAPFDYYARTMSETTTAPSGGELGWVRPAALPPELATAANQMQVGQLAGPIENSGGFSILYLVDKRKVLEADPRAARLSLKQIKISFPAGTTQADAQARAAEFAKTVQSINGCGSVGKAAAGIGAEVVDNDQLTVRDLPGALQEMILNMQVGQATPPFGSPTEGVSSLVLCGRDEAPGGNLPSAGQVQDQMEQQRVNLRAAKILRDLRRDAIIEYR